MHAAELEIILFVSFPSSYSQRMRSCSISWVVFLSIVIVFVVASHADYTVQNAALAFRSRFRDVPHAIITSQIPVNVIETSSVAASWSIDNSDVVSAISKINVDEKSLHIVSLLQGIGSGL